MYHTYASTCREIINKLVYNVVRKTGGHNRAHLTRYLAAFSLQPRQEWERGFRLLGTTGLLPFEHSGPLPLLHAEQIRERIDAENLRGKGSALLMYTSRDEENPYIEGDKHDKDSNIPPAMRILDIEIVVEIFVRRAIATKLALRGRAGVRDVSSVGGDVPSEVLGTRLTRRWIDISVLDAEQSTCCPPRAKTSVLWRWNLGSERSELTVAQQAFDEVRVRRHPIHPPPPTQCPERLQDTIARSLCEPRYGSKTR
jgi:hypothetical protein